MTNDPILCLGNYTTVGGTPARIFYLIPEPTLYEHRLLGITVRSKDGQWIIERWNQQGDPCYDENNRIPVGPVYRYGNVYAEGLTVWHDTIKSANDKARARTMHRRVAVVRIKLAKDNSLEAQSAICVDMTGEPRKPD